MTTFNKVANRAETSVATAYTSGGVAMTVTSGTLFPAAPFLFTVDDEIFACSSKGTGANWTVAGAQESTVAADHANGVAVRHNITAGQITAIQTAINATEAYSVLTERGSIVYRNATVPAELTHGTAGQVLQTGGDGADPSWLTVDNTAGGTDASIAPVTSNVVYDHTQAADPHTGYRLESADHTHATTGAQGGQLTSPLVNEAVAMTVTATNLNLVDDANFWYLAYRGQGQAIIPLHNWYSGTTGSGTVANNGPTRLYNSLGTTTLSSCLQAVWPMNLGLVQQVNYGYSFRTLWREFNVLHEDSANETTRLGFRAQVLPTMITLAVKGVEIYVTGASNRLWLCTHNGTTLTTLDTEFDFTSFRPYDVEFVFTAATKFEVFVNGVSKGSITTDLPTGTLQTMGWFGTIRSGGVGVSNYRGSTMGIPALYSTYTP